MDIKAFALNLLSRNPQIANNPQAQAYLNIIKSGDSTKGEEIAKNLCATYGVTTDQAVNQAKRFFNL